MVDSRPLLDTSLLERLSVGSPEELGLLLDTAALFDELPFREVRPLSESGCCHEKHQDFLKYDFDPNC